MIRKSIVFGSRHRCDAQAVGPYLVHASRTGDRKHPYAVSKSGRVVHRVHSLDEGVQWARERMHKP